MEFSSILNIVSILGMLMFIMGVFMYCFGFSKKGIIKDSLASHVQSLLKQPGKGSTFSSVQSIGASIGFIKIALIGLGMVFFNPNILKIVSNKFNIVPNHFIKI